MWCTFHKSGTHSDDQCYHQRHGRRNSSTDSKSTKYETFVVDSNVTERGCQKMGTYFEMGTDGHRFVCFQIGIS